MTPRTTRLATILVAATALLATRAIAQPTAPATAPRPLPMETTPLAVAPTPAQPTANNAPILLGPQSASTKSTTPAVSGLLPAGNPDERISPNWTAMPLSLAIPEIEKLTGRTIIRPATLANVADLSLSFATPPTRAEFLQAIETLFTINQLSLIPRGDKFLILVPLNATRNEAPTIIEGSTLDLPPSGRIASKLFQLEFLRVAEFAPTLGTILNAQIQTISLYEKSNALLITDSIATLQRIETIIKQVDRPAATPVQAKFYSLEYAKASDIVNKLKTIFVGPLQQQLGASTSFNADDRTNQVVIIADPRQLAFFDDLVKKLDVKADPNTRNEVIRLKTADCGEVANIIAQIVSGQTRAAQVAAGTTGGGGIAQRQFAPTTVQTQGGQNRNNQNSNRNNQNSNRGNNQQQGQGGNNRASMQQQSGGQNSGGGGNTAQTQQATGARTGTGGSVTPSFATAGSNITGGSLGLEGNEFSSYLTVQPDVRTNSIVVSGTVDDIRIIKELVEKLDVILAQVRIEVVIAEVSLSDEASTGIDSLGLNVVNGKLVGIRGGGPGFSMGSTLDDKGNTAGFSILKPLTAAIGINSTPRKNNTTIVSVPAITTMHNKEGRIFVGETRPVVTASTTNLTGGANTSSVTQMEIGTTITVTPLIGYDGTVQLTIAQEISDVSGNVLVDGNTQYIIGKRNTGSTIIAKSGEILVLGGIQKNTASKTSSRLGPIPIIGDLLGKRSRNQNRTELIFFLRPIVLTNTFLDNESAYKQLDAMPNKEAVQKALGQTPTPPSDVSVDLSSSQTPGNTSPASQYQKL